MSFEILNENENEIDNRNDKSKSSKENIIEIEYNKKVGNYLLTEQIGLGTFSKVTKAIHILTKEKVAIKILDKSKIKDKIDIERIYREIEILKSINHPNISQLYESNSTIHNFYLILEYIEGGDLCDYINKNICLKEPQACHFFRQIISAIEYLYDMGITHRDIKPENILLDSSHENIKVIDFGLSNYCSDLELLHSACGSPCFASPEMLSGNPYNGITTDIWSSGIVLYSMLVGTLPFDDQELNSLYDQIKIGTFYIPSTLSLEAIDFLKSILRVDPTKRLNIEQIKKHPWFNIVKNIMHKGIDLTIETFPYDENLIDYVINKYYKDDNDINKDNFTKMIQYHACNQYTATYYLTQNIFKRNKNLVINSNENKNKNKKINLKNEFDFNNNYKDNENKICAINENDNNNKNNLNGKKNENIFDDKNNNHNLINENDKKTAENQQNNNNSKNKNMTHKEKKLKYQLNKNNNINIKETKDNNNSKSNSVNKYKDKKNVNNKEKQKITIIKKYLISFKKPPYINIKPKKVNNLNNKKSNLLTEQINIDNNKKLTSKINDILGFIKKSENNSKIKKAKSKKKNMEKKIKKKIILDKKNITRNHYINYNLTEFQKQSYNSSKNSNKNNNMKKDNISLTDRGNFSNSIFGEEQKVLSFNNSKMQSIRAEKNKKNKNLSSYKKTNISNNSKNIRKKDNISMNISRNDFLKKNKKIKFKKELIDLKIINKKFPNFSFNKHKKNFYISTNINYKKVKINKKDYILTDNNKNDKIAPEFIKIKYLDSTNFSLNRKNKNIKSQNNTINKYKELINEFNSGNSENQKLKNSFSKLENKYFKSFNQKYDSKNRNKNYILNKTHFISKTNTLNNISKFISNDNNIEELSKINQKLFKNSIKNKKKLEVNNNVKYKLYHTNKYKKSNLKIDIGPINTKINSNIMALISKKIKNKKSISKTQRNNSSFKKYYNSFMKGNKNNRIKNPFSQNISMSYQNSNKNIKNIDNNKKFINININNILKISKKFSINLTKSTETTNHNINNNYNDSDKNLKKFTCIKNYNSSYPLSNDINYKYKGAIKYYTSSKNKNELIYPKIRNNLNTNRNYSSLLKKQFLEENFFNKNKNI